MLDNWGTKSRWAGAPREIHESVMVPKREGHACLGRAERGLVPLDPAARFVHDQSRGINERRQQEQEQQCQHPT